MRAANCQSRSRGISVDQDTEGTVMDLSAHYLGLNLRNPLVASASPRANSVDGVRRLAR